MLIKRKWGKMWLLIHTKKFWLKVIHVNKGKTTSMQYHNKRSELHLSPRSVKWIPIKEWHQMSEGWYIELAFGRPSERDITRAL